MSVKICHASIDENRRISGGKAGDQTGKEVLRSNWYSKPWNVMLRYKDKTVAKKASDIAKKLADSNLVGYDQSQRNTLYQALKKHNWNVDSYIKSGVKTETDCSAFIYAVWCCVLPSMRSDSNAPTTRTMRPWYMKHGFKMYTDTEYLTKDKYLLVGDILIKEGSHTVMAITNGSTTTTQKKSVSKIAKEVIDGKWGNGTDRKKKVEAAGYNYDEVQKEVNKLLKK